MSDIIKKEAGVPETFNPWTVNGFEEKEDLIFPRAKIFQGTATEFEAHPNGKPGMIMNHITGEELPSTFIPFLKFKQYAKFNPNKPTDPGWDDKFPPRGLIWITTDSTDPRVAECKFGENGEKPTAIEFMNFMAIFDGQDFPIIIPFSKTSLRAGKRLFSMLAFSGGGLGKKYKLTTKKMQKDGQTYYVFDVNPAGNAKEEEIKKAESLYHQFKQKAQEIKPQVDEEVNWDK